MIRSAALLANADRAFVVVLATDDTASRGVVTSTDVWTTARRQRASTRHVGAHATATSILM